MSKKRAVPSKSQGEVTKRASRPKRRFWRQKLAIAGVLLTAILLFVDGPGARSLVGDQLHKELAKLGLVGSFDVHGNLHKGFTLKRIKLKGEEKITQLEAQQIKVSYRLNRLLNKEIDLLSITGLRLQLDFDRKTLDKKEKEPSDKSLFETLESIRPFVTPAKIAITDSKIIAKKSERTVTLAIAEIAHASGSADIFIKNYQFRDHLNRLAETEQTTINWTSEHLTLDRLQALPQLRLSGLKITKSSEIDGDLQLAGANFALQSNSQDQHEIRLKSGVLDLKEAAAIWDPEIEVQGGVKTLELTLSLQKDKLPDIDLQAEVEKFAWSQKKYPDFMIDLSYHDQKPHLALGLQLSEKMSQLTLASQEEITPDNWKGRQFDFTLNAPFDDNHLFEVPKDLAGIFSAKGTVLPDSDLSKLVLSSVWTLDLKENERAFPRWNGTLAWQDDTVLSTASTFEKGVDLEFDYRRDADHYLLKAQIELPDAQVLAPYIDLASSPEKEGEILAAETSAASPAFVLQGPLSFVFNSEGQFKKSTHQGQGEIKNAQVQVKNQPSTKLSGKFSWDWPEKLSIVELTAETQQASLVAAAYWEKNRADIKSLSLKNADKEILTAKGSFFLPLGPQEEGLSDKSQPLDFILNSETITLDQLREFLPIPESMNANLLANLSVSGTMGQPNLTGDFSATGIQDTRYPQVPPADFSLKLITSEQRLNFDGKATESNGSLLDLVGSIPFAPVQWLEHEVPEDLPLTLDIKSPQLQLERLHPFLGDSLETLAGYAEIDLTVRGTVKEPDWRGSVNLHIDRARLAKGPISDFRDSNLSVEFNQKTATLAPSTFNAAGGKLTLSGEIGLSDGLVFDLDLTADNALLWRNDIFSLRADAKLTFTGPLANTRLAGNMAIVESLVYKDIEILPTGMSNNGTPRAELPSFKTGGGKFSTGLKPPFGDCRLDIRLVTQDPILVRGNIAEGTITGDTRIGGTLRNPEASGQILIENLVASLPFSQLNVSHGVVTLRPEALTDPFINIRGTSTIKPYDLQLYVSGSVSNPLTSFSSSPPLPEHEIMALLATGSTTSVLGDQSLASQKALQYLVEGLRRRYLKPDSDNPFQRLLRNADQIELNLGENDLLSGRRFTSATIDISSKWDFTAAIDDKGYSRGFLTYSLRFK